MINATKNHHILIAGTSGSGKSTLIRNIIETLKQETDSQFILIDPKRVELMEYKHLPKTLDYANNEDDIYTVLEDAYERMMDRYEVMEEKNQRTSEEPHIFVIVDEMAPLMQGPKRKEYIQWFNQIALLGRAAHVHLILCTQVSTQDVIPACIRDNMENVVCLRQRNAQKYRYLLEQNMPRLPEYGFAYVYTPAMFKPEKVRTEEVWSRING